ncbi:MAG TPA: polyprenyl synthetase family protein, partial [Geobacteraceae bacterium]
LLSAACHAGDVLGKASPECEEAMRAFGLYVGIAFQLMDDTVDYVASEEQFGKPIGHDLEEGKITLPLIHTLQNCTADERSVIADIIEKDVLGDDDFDTVCSLVHRYGGLEYAVERAGYYIALGKKNLEMFPDSPGKSAMLSLADYIVTRKR